MEKSSPIISSKKSEFAILIAVVSVSFSAIFIRWSDSHPLVIAMYRMGITSLILLPVVLLKNYNDIKNLNRNEICWITLIGIILAIHFATWITSLKETSVASSVILVTSHPLFVAIISHYFYKEKLKMIGYLGIMTAFTGVLILTAGDLGRGGSHFRGDLLALVGGLAAGLYILGGRKMRKDIPLVPYAFLVYSICTLSLLPACILISAPIYPLPAREYELFILMAIFPTILGHTLYNFALKYVKAQVISVSLLGEPIGASILAYLLLSEGINMFTAIGGGLILVGIFITYSYRDQKKSI
jgi:drug/metabolite transporter (DMT)-like permease